jgi:hypothetical protein
LPRAVITPCCWRTWRCAPREWRCGL